MYTSRSSSAGGEGGKWGKGKRKDVFYYRRGLRVEDEGKVKKTDPSEVYAIWGPRNRKDKRMHSKA